MQVNGDTLFVYSEGEGILLVNISDVYNPVIIGLYDQSNSIEKFKIRNNQLFTSLGYKGLELVDIYELSNLLLLYEYRKTDHVQSVEIQSNIAYMGMEENGLQVIDISNPINPFDLGYIDSLKRVRKIEYNSGYLYCSILDDYHKINIIDVNDPNNPEKVNELYSALFINDYKVENNVLYLLEDSEWLKFFDLSNPALPIEIVSYQQEGHRLAIDSNLLAISFWSTLKTFKIGANYSLTNCDEVSMGDSPREIEIYFPYLNIGTSSGAAVVELDDYYNISICDEIIYGGWTSFTNAMTSNENFIFLGGHYGGSDQIVIIDIKDPYNISVIQSINRYCLDFGLKQKMLFTAESQNGYSIYGDIPVSISQQTNSQDHIELLTLPNPFSNYLIIDFNNPTLNNSTLRIYELNGQLIDQFDASGKQKIKINTENYKNGIFIMELINDIQIISSKAIKIN